ncbi:LysR family transcriptional regulator [Marinobacterium lutimaris]|uniref:Transcriptional regulator, LysR family n=1 Tax=Marinobacterium lutimaris TaxID=568106 RepID=A0A1H5XBL0_9GAMM|nr:LysR family transcriptional regulator [Marinobacterium lutimaris]SEG08596.1 transcriptional regulator, LysR family [Marinobacterium lutimaris]
MKSEDVRFAGVLEFVETLRTGSFTAAGAKLGLTGSAVGKSVTRLEKRLGTKMLHRTTRSLTPTQEGQRMFDGWVAILDEIEALEQGVVAGSGTVSGRMNIHLPAAFGRRHVVPLLSRLAKQYPQLELSVNFTERRINLIDEGVDLVVRIGTLEDDADLVARRLGQQRLVICASPEYLGRYGTPQTPAELTEHDCIIGSRRSNQPAWLLKDARGQLCSQVIRARFDYSDGDAMVQGTLDGLGLSQLPTWLVHDHIQRGELITVLDNHAGAEMPIHAVWPRSRYLQPRQRVVIDCLIEESRQPGSIYQL